MSESRAPALLQSLVELTLALFDARACSIMRLDVAAGELVFAAVAGEGAGTLVGRRLPATSGIAGWSLASEEPISIDDVVSHPRFDREFAAQTGYIPRRLTVHPLLAADRSLGVLNVLDAGMRLGLEQIELLGRIAGHAAVALASVDDREAAPEDPLQRLAHALETAEPARREAALAALAAVERLLS